MSLSLRKLLHNPALRLRLVGDEHEEQRALDEEFEWLHATDLLDPIPFLGPAEVILTLGWQFPVTHPATPSIARTTLPTADVARIYDDYVALLMANGVIGIGFGSDIVHRGVPQQLADACQRHGLILCDVPYEISFMDLLQEAARVLQRDQTERYTRSLRAQKAIATAATRRDGLNATLQETARQLGCGVALYDPLARPVTLVEAPEGPRVTAAELTPIVQQVLDQGQRFRTTSVTPEVEAVLQMLGEPADPTGMLVLTLSRGFDDVSRNVLSSVLALVSVSLEQNQALARLHGNLREALLQLLLSGSTDVTKHIVESVWGALPQPPLVVLVGISQSYDPDRLFPTLDTLNLPEALPVFVAKYRSDAAVLLQEADAERYLDLIAAYGLTIGRSRCDRWEDLGVALDEAKKAAEVSHRRGTPGVIAFTEIWRDGITDLINTSDAEHISRRLLAPLRRNDEHERSDLVHTLHIWLTQHGKHLPAARELGIHRHTLTARLEQIELLLGVDLDDFQARAELALALRYQPRL